MPEETDDDDDDDEAERVGEGGAWRAFLSPVVVVVGSSRGVLAQDDMAEGLSTRFARRKVKNAIKQFVSRAIPIPPSWFPLLSSLCLFSLSSLTWQTLLMPPSYVFFRRNATERGPPPPTPRI